MGQYQQQGAGRCVWGGGGGGGCYVAVLGVLCAVTSHKSTIVAGYVGFLVQ